MKPIGGYFEAELGPPTVSPHEGTVSYHSGRACLRALIEALGLRRVFVPFYICDSAVLAAQAAKCEVSFYRLKEDLTPIEEPDLGVDEAILYVNYFGLCGERLERLEERYGNALIADQTQSFFSELSGNAFNSARKFFGVPDGAYCAGPYDLETPDERAQPAHDHLWLRALGLQEKGFEAYQLAESQISGDLLGMSTMAETLLNHVDYAGVGARRRSNFARLGKRLDRVNRFDWTLESSVPYCYPFWPKGDVPRERLLSRQIYFPKLWPELATRAGESFEFERELADRCLALPIDQRYSDQEMDYIAATVEECVA